MVSKDLKDGDQMVEWMHVVMDQKKWRAVVTELAEDLNDEAEWLEKERMDDKKKRREEEMTSGLVWPCQVISCTFAVSPKAGLIIHQR